MDGWKRNIPDECQHRWDKVETLIYSLTPPSHQPLLARLYASLESTS